MNMPLNLAEWLQSHSLTKNKFFSLVFVPERTFDDILNGVRSIPALQRIYLLTGLDNFKPTEQELVKYVESFGEKKKLSHSLDFAIAERFILHWKKTGEMPPPEEMLQVSHAKRKNRAELAEMLQKKYFTFEGGRYVPITTPTRISTNDVYQQVLEELESIGNLSPEEQRIHIRTYKTKIKSLYGILGILMQNEDPAVAFTAIGKAKKTFFNS